MGYLALGLGEDAQNHMFYFKGLWKHVSKQQSGMLFTFGLGRT